ncbi:MAG: hypothetical protein LCH81_18685 [Bacteroidetes bacterium]|jgi:hypothetical protein|nr:hypothetical protein [Bacteroidota bacterium]
MVFLLNVLTLIALVATVFAIVNPGKAVFWKKENADLSDVMRSYMPVFILLALLAAFVNLQ